MGWAKPQLARRRQIIATLLEKFPDTGSRTLARMLHEKHPVIFDTLENARSSVRAYLGNCGVRHRKSAEKRGTARAPRKPGELPPLPKSEAKPWEPFVLDARRVLVLSDLHIPHSDDAAVDAALGYGDEFKPDAILLNGDLADFYQISRFDKDPTVPKIKYELACLNQFFCHLAARFPKARVYYKLGNHDERLDRYLMLNAPELFDIPEIRYAWHGPAGITANKVTVIDDQRKVMLGKLMVLHGHEKGRGISNPVNPARGAFLRLLTSSLEGHSHQQSEHTERSADGRTIVCRSTGCLCDLEPPYARVNRWSHGFATVIVEASGDYHAKLHRIINGKVL
jgi:predicted phosphodiesterase